MHSKHTSLHTCGWWLSGPFPFALLHSRVIGGLLKGPSSSDESCFIRLGSHEPGAHMKPLDIYSSTTVLQPLSGLNIVTSSSSTHILKRRQTPPLAFSCIVSIWGSHCEQWRILLRLNRFQGQKSWACLLLKNERNILTEPSDLLWEKRIVSSWLSLCFDVSLLRSVWL